MLENWLISAEINYIFHRMNKIIHVRGDKPICVTATGLGGAVLSTCETCMNFNTNFFLPLNFTENEYLTGPYSWCGYSDSCYHTLDTTCSGICPETLTVSAFNISIPSKNFNFTSLCQSSTFPPNLNSSTQTSLLLILIVVLLVLSCVCLVTIAAAAVSGLTICRFGRNTDNMNNSNGNRNMNGYKPKTRARPRRSSPRAAAIISYIFPEGHPQGASLDSDIPYVDIYTSPEAVQPDGDEDFSYIEAVPISVMPQSVEGSPSSSAAIIVANSRRANSIPIFI